MESEQMCKNHPKQSLSWICLERNCQQRVMCSTCAVKLHDRNHKLEELYNIYENGCLATYFSNKKNSSAGLLQLVNGEQDNIFENEQYDDYLQEGIERCLRNVSKKIEETKGQLIQQHEKLKENKENERINFIAQLNELDESLKGSSNLEVDIENAFLQIQSFVQKKELEMANNKESAILLRKIRLLELMKDNFLKMIKSYFHNQFTAEFCHLFDMQIETLNAREVDDVQGFLEYMDSKWKQDYRNIQLSIEKFVGRLNEGLKYCIGMPLENQKKQFVVRSPMRQFPINIQTPTYHQFTSPKHVEFTKSQVIYEEPSQRKNIKIEPVMKYEDTSNNESQSTSIFHDQQINGIISGPRYDNRGDIIKRSIVGTVDQFQREGKVQQDSRVTDEDSSMIRSFVITQFNKKQNNKIKREPVQLNKISKEEILLHIDKVQNNIKLSQTTLRSKEKILPLIERNLLTKERRILESCEEQQEKWNDLEQELANRCERSHNNTLLRRSQGYREKKQLLDSLNTLQKEPNVKEWYGKLRNYDQSIEPTIEIIKNGNNVQMCNNKFKNMINQRLNNKYYDADYLVVNGNSKLRLESQEATDLMILPQNIVQQQTQDFNYSNYNQRDISRRSSYRIIQLQ